MHADVQLNGARVLVTRPEQQAQRLCEMIAERQGKALRFPVIQILPVEGPCIEPENREPGWQFDWVIFISRNAVHFAHLLKNGRINAVNNSKFAAIGHATAKAMREAGFGVDLIPEQGYNSEALLALAEFQEITGQQFLIVKGVGGRGLLIEALRQRGATVAVYEVYKRVKPACDSTELIKNIRSHKLDCITVTSCEALQNLVAMVGEQVLADLCTIPVVVISERIERLALSLGFKIIEVTSMPSDQGIINTIAALINGE